MLVVAIVLGAMLYGLFLGSSLWLIVSASSSGDYDCALGGAFLSLILLFFGALALA